MNTPRSSRWLPLLASFLALRAGTLGAASTPDFDFGGNKAPANLPSQCPMASPSGCNAPSPDTIGSVNLFSGEYTIDEEDVRIPGTGMDVSLQRTYVSRWRPISNAPPQSAPVVTQLLGENWDHAYNLYLEASDAGKFPCGQGAGTGGTNWISFTSLRVFDGHARSDVWEPDHFCEQVWVGNHYIYIPIIGSSYTREERNESIVEDARDPATGDVTGFTMTFADGGLWHFAAPPGARLGGQWRAYVDRIEDRNGNTIRIIRDSDQWLAAITDTRGQTLWFENLDSLVSRVHLPDGRLVDYTKDENLRLASITWPYFPGPGVVPPIRRSYEYEIPSPQTYLPNLTRIRDAKGDVVIENEYSTGVRSYDFITPTQPGNAYCPSGEPRGSVPRLDFDHLVRQRVSGGIIDYTYSYIVAPTPDAPCTRLVRAVVNDGMGNVSVSDFDGRNFMRRHQEYSGRARPDEPTTAVPDTGWLQPVRFQSNAPTGPLRPADALGPGDPPLFETSWIPAIHNGYSTGHTQLPRGNTVQRCYNNSISVPCSGGGEQATPSGEVPAGRPRGVFSRPGFLTPPAGTPELARRVNYAVDDYQFCEGWGPELLLPTCDLALNNAGPPSLKAWQYDGRGNQTRAMHYASGHGSTNCGTDQCEDWEYDNGDPSGPGLVTAYIHPDNGSGHRQRDEYVWYGDLECPDPSDTSNPFCVQRGRLKSLTTDVDGSRAVTYFEYDLRGNPIHQVLPNETKIDRTFDERDLLLTETTTLKLAGDITATYQAVTQRDANGRVVRKDLANITEDGTQNQGHAWLTSVVLSDSLGRPFATFSEVEDVEDTFWDELIAAPDLDDFLADHGKDPRFAYTRTWYDAAGNVSEIWSPEATNGNQPGNITRKECDERGKLFRDITAPGTPAERVDQFDYDANGNLIRERRGINAPVSGSWDGPRVTTHEYDAFDRKIGSSDPSGTTERVTLDDLGNVLRRDVKGIVDPTTATPRLGCLSSTMYEYDGISRVVATHVALFDPLALTDCPSNTPQSSPSAWSTVSTTYAPTGGVLTVTDPVDGVTRTEYDSAGRAHRVIDARGNETIVDFDVIGSPIQTELRGVSDIDGSTRTTVATAKYDGAGRRISARDPMGHESFARYDARGNPTTSVDERGNVVHAEFDGLGHVVRTIRDITTTGDGSGMVIDTVVTRQEYDANGRLVAQVDDNDNATRITFDEASRPLSVRFADGTERTSEFNTFGEEVRSTDPNGTVLQYVRDRSGQMRERRLVSAAPGVDLAVQRDTFDYDGAGRPVRSQRLGPSGSLLLGRVVRHFDSRGLALSETIDGRAVAFSFDAAGRRTSLTAPAGLVVTARFDALGRVRDLAEGSVTGVDCAGPTPDAQCLLHQDFAGGRLQDRTFGNGMRRTLGYNDDLLPVLDRHHRADDSTLESLSLNYNTAHDLVSRSSSDGPVAIRQYEHDSLGRLTQSRATPYAGGPVVVDYDLDGVNNRLKVTGGSDSGTYVMAGQNADVNQYTSTPTGSREYDRIGNVRTARLPDGTTRTFRWDALNVLGGVDDAGPNPMQRTYVHDAMGRRIGLTVTGPGWTLARTFVFDGDRILEERDGTTGLVIASYVHGDRGVDDLVAVRKPTGTLWTITDPLGSVLGLVDDAGQAVERYHYDDFGQPHFMTGSRAAGFTEIPGSQQGMAFLYTGHRYDEDLGLYDARARLYDPRIGRFISRDPLGFWGDPLNLGNPFGYVGNRPTRFVDRLGLFALSAGETGEYFDPDNPHGQRYRPVWDDEDSDDDDSDDEGSSDIQGGGTPDGTDEKQDEDGLEALTNWLYQLWRSFDPEFTQSNEAPSTQALRSEIGSRQEGDFTRSTTKAVIGGVVRGTAASGEAALVASDVAAAPGAGRAAADGLGDVARNLRRVVNRVNLPAWRKVAIDMEHIASGHMAGGSRVSPLKTLFPERMGTQQVERAVREAYRYGDKIKSQGESSFVRGEGGGLVIEMWVNRTTKTIETAYPVW